MKEFIDKLIEKLNDRMEHLDSRHKILTDAGLFKESDKIAYKMVEIDFIKQIVNELAEEYINCSTDISTNKSDTSTISKMENVGWIPCSERFPEEDTMVLLTADVLGKTEIQYVFYQKNLGLFICNGKPIAWMPLTAPYTEGE